MGYKLFQVYTDLPIRSMCPIPETRVVLTGSGRSLRVTLNYLNGDSALQIELPVRGESGISSIDVSKLRKTTSASCMDAIILHDVSKQVMARRFQTLTMTKIMDAKFLAEDLLVSCGHSKGLSFFDLRSPRSGPISTVSMGDDHLNTLTFDPVLPELVTAGSVNGFTYTLDVRNQTIINDMVTSSSVSCVVQAPKMKCVVRTRNNTTVIFDQDNSRILDIVRAGNEDSNTKILYNIAYGYSNDRIFNGTDRGLVQIWKWDDETCRANLETTLEIGITEGGYKDFSLSHTHYLEHVNTVVASSGSGWIHAWNDVF